jgi:hypothetical protein
MKNFRKFLVDSSFAMEYTDKRKSKKLSKKEEDSEEELEDEDDDSEDEDNEECEDDDFEEDEDDEDGDSDEDDEEDEDSEEDDEQDIDEWINDDGVKKKRINGFNDYGVTKDGRVYSYLSHKYLKQDLSTGSYRVKLAKNGKYHSKCVHMLVAEAYIDNPKEHQYVLHINDDIKNKQYNCVDNLRWSKYHIDMKKQKKSQNGKPVLCYEMDGTFVARYESTMEAERLTGLNAKGIQQAARTGGYSQDHHWVYVNGPKITPKIKNNEFPVIRIDPDTDEIIDVFPSMAKAAESVNKELEESKKIGKPKHIGASNISDACKGRSHTSGGYEWKLLSQYIEETDPLEMDNKVTKFIKKYEHKKEINKDEIRSREWKKLEGLSKYRISEDGEIFSEHIKKLMETKISKRGYICLNLVDDEGYQHTFDIHQLVAKCYIPNPDPKKYNMVNHKNGHKDENNYKNLEWLDADGNNLHAIKTGLRKVHKVGRYDPETEEMIEYNSVKEAAEDLPKKIRVSERTIRRACCNTAKAIKNGKDPKLCAGYIFSYIS